MFDYSTLGYNKHLNKPDTGQQQTPAVDTDLLIEAINANKISEGVSQSDALKIDYNEGQIQTLQGKNTRVAIGKFSDGKYGIRIYDSFGNVISDQTS